jgi:hypothetical protein
LRHFRRSGKGFVRRYGGVVTRARLRAREKL